MYGKKCTSGQYGQKCTKAQGHFSQKLKGGERPLVIQKNSRQIPRQETIVSNRDYCDLVYSWFQCESISNEDGNRIVNKSQVNYSHIGQQLGMDRRTVARYIKKLVELGLLVEEGPGYTLQKLEPCAATLVPFVTLRQIQNALHKNSVSIFVYLLNRFIANQYEAFIVTYAELKKYIGISTATASNNVIIVDILKVLQKLELIQYHTVYTEDKHAHLEILSARNVI